MKKPKILALDIETFYMELSGWQLYDANFSVGDIEQDWTLASWAAKWVGEKTVFYQGLRKSKNKRAEHKILPGIWRLINEADVLLTQNGKSFDLPKLNAKFIEHGLPPLDEKEHIDTKRLAKGRFKFTSNSLEYLCKVLKTKHQKLKHKRFPGKELWKECLLGNPLAWSDMKRYNIHDVLCLEDVYLKLRPWGLNVNLAKYTKSAEVSCTVCTSEELTKYGFAYKGQSKFQRYHCDSCGALVRGKINLLSKKKKTALKG